MDGFSSVHVPAPDQVDSVSALATYLHTLRNHIPGALDDYLETIGAWLADINDQPNLPIADAEAHSIALCLYMGLIYE